MIGRFKFAIQRFADPWYRLVEVGCNILGGV